jgi:SAM-dependent methyltransferase
VNQFRVTRLASEFWDQHHHISEDPDFWMAHPLCRKAINRRVSGNESVYPLDYLYVCAGRPVFRSVLSLGCGTGRLERAMASLGIASSIDAVDGSVSSLDIARAKAAEEGLSGIRYQLADLNHIRLPCGAYDAVVFHHSLHHVGSVEKLLDRVRGSLSSTGVLFLDEWTGPARSEWTTRELAAADSLFQAVPAAWRRWPRLRAPVELNDPSEAIRSSAIRPAVHRIFSVVQERPYGGHLLSVLLPQLERSRIPTEKLDELVSTWLSLEDEDLVRGSGRSYHTAILATPRKGAALVGGRAIGLAIRAGLAMRYRVVPILRGAQRIDQR